MKNGATTLYAVALLLALCAKVANATSVATVANLTLMGGQNFIDGTASSVGGNPDAVVTFPSFNFPIDGASSPRIMDTIEGTEQIQALAGGGMLFRDHTGQALLLKSVHKLGSWKLKPSLGVSAEWLRETRDEDWGQGLYDYRKWNGGFEVEYDLSFGGGGPRGVQTIFNSISPITNLWNPNWTPRFLGSWWGKVVLNNANHMLTGGAWTPLPAQGRLDVSCMADTRLYDDQPVVDRSGAVDQYGQERRHRQR